MHLSKQLVPDYYYRMNPDGTSRMERVWEMRQPVNTKCSASIWLIPSYTGCKNTNIDGFRFDLMGIHDVKTMQMIRQSLDEIDPNIILYGEGWDMGTGLAPYDKAKKDNAYQMPNIGFF